MKLTLGMDAKLPETMRDTEEKPKRSRLIAGIAIGLVTLVTVATVVIVSVYFGVKLTQNNYKESWVTYHTDKGETVQEKIKVVNDDEVDVTVPNEMRLVYDYKHGIIVYRFRDDESKEGACYAYHMNRTQAGTPSQVQKDMANTEVNVKTESESSEKKFLFTDRLLPIYMLSENVQEMCDGTDVYWMELSRDDGIEKRSTPCNTWYKWYLYCWNATDGYRYCYYAKKYYCPDGTTELYWIVVRME